MATRKTGARSSFSANAADNDAAKAVSDSAQKIWLAGLGAFERAKAEGPRMFDTLVEQGKGLAERARGAADQAMKAVRENANDAGGRFDKFEQALEDRVAKSLGRLGVLTRGEVSDLSNQVRELADNVRAMMAANANAGAAGSGSKASRAGTSKRRSAAKAGAAKAGATKRKAKRAVSSLKRGAGRKAKAKSRRAAA
jgi:poly(hydroxyalkanoate) granule-associated protein